MVVVHGNPAINISDFPKTEIVFKDGVGYDSAAILKSVAGQDASYAIAAILVLGAFSLFAFPVIGHQAGKLR